MGDDEQNRWMKHASCRGLDPNMFMPERGDTQKIKEAKQLCKQCSVVDDCRNYGLQLARQYDTYGIFGGLTRHERDIILRNQRRTGQHR